MQEQQLQAEVDRLRRDLASRQVDWSEAQRQHEAVVQELRADRLRLGDEISKEVCLHVNL